MKYRLINESGDVSDWFDRPEPFNTLLTYISRSISINKYADCLFISTVESLDTPPCKFTINVMNDSTNHEISTEPFRGDSQLTETENSNIRSFIWNNILHDDKLWWIHSITVEFMYSEELSFQDYQIRVMRQIKEWFDVVPKHAIIFDVESELVQKIAHVMIKRVVAPSIWKPSEYTDNVLSAARDSLIVDLLLFGDSLPDYKATIDAVLI